MSAADLTALLTELPPGADIFQAVQQYLDGQIFPDLGRSFWVQFYVSIGVLTVSVILFMASLSIKTLRGRINLILSDGSCSRLELKFAIPILWSTGAIFQVIFAYTFKQCFDRRHFTYFLGLMWFFPYIPFVVSYTLLSASIVANVPALRRYLNGVSHGLFRYNGLVLAFIVLNVAGMVPPALRHGGSLRGISKAYRHASEGIQAAAATQDFGALLALEPYLADLDLADKNYRAATRIATGVYAGYLFMYLVMSIMAFMILRRTVNRKIFHLENDSCSAMSSCNALSSPPVAESHEQPSSYVHLQKLGNTSKLAGSTLPPQPKDRPFAQLVKRQTTHFPHRFHVILQDREQTAVSRARRLRAMLATDLRYLLAYFVILVTLLILCLYMSVGGQGRLSVKQDFLLGYSWPVWNFALPAIIAAVLLFREAIFPPPDEVEQQYASRHKRKASRTFPPADITGIQCDQVVNVVCTEGKESIAGDVDEEKGYGR